MVGIKFIKRVCLFSEIVNDKINSRMEANFTVISKDSIHDSAMGSSCGYCSKPKGSYTFGFLSPSMRADDYESIMVRGWRRCGDYYYKNNIATTCCPPFTIRLDVTKYKLSKEQKKVLKKFEKFLKGKPADIKSSAKLSSIKTEDPILDAIATEIEVALCKIILQYLLESKTAFNFVDIKKMIRCKKDSKYAPLTTSCLISISHKLKLDLALFSNEIHNRLLKSELYIKYAILVKLENGNINFNSDQIHKQIKPKNVAKAKMPDHTSKAELSKISDKMEIPKSIIKTEVPREETKAVIPKDQIKAEITNDATKVDIAKCTTKQKKQKAPKLIKEEKKSLPVSEDFYQFKAYFEEIKPIVFTHPPEHTYKIELIPAAYNKNSYTIYEDYLLNVYGKHTTTLSYRNFLCKNCLSSDNLPQKLPYKYGSYHMIHRIDDKIAAVGVLDILPKYLSSVYLFYNPDYSFLNLGTLTAIREIEFMRKMMKQDECFKYYAMGFYIPDCLKMSYKAKFNPSEIMCPFSYQFCPLEKCAPLLKTRKPLIEGGKDAMCPQKEEVDDVISKVVGGLKNKEKVDATRAVLMNFNRDMLCHIKLS